MKITSFQSQQTVEEVVLKYYLVAKILVKLIVIGFINAIAIHAEAMDHHPEIRLYGWNKLDISISTHDKGGLTLLDMDLASKIDAITF